MMEQELSLTYVDIYGNLFQKAYTNSCNEFILFLTGLESIVENPINDMTLYFIGDLYKL